MLNKTLIDHSYQLRVCLLPFVPYLIINSNTMTKRYFTFLALLCFTTQLSAQNTIRGIVQDKATAAPIAGANIYMNNSQIGTTSGKDGTFSLSIPASGKISLFFSHVGYKTAKQSIISADSLYLTVSLVEDELQLTEYEISSSSDKKWERQLRRFQSLFLGNDRFSKSCTILNPWILEFDDKNGVFSARSNQVLKVRNEATGYLMTYYLSDFHADEELVSYKGLTSFTALEPSDLTQYNKWQNNRQTAYNGSFRHFLKSVVERNLEENGFEAKFIYDLEGGEQSQVPGDPYAVKDREVADSTLFTFRNGKRYLNFARYIQIDYYGSEQGEKNQTSSVDLISVTAVNQQGVLEDPSSIIAYGQMSKENFAYLLPLEYTNQSTGSNLLKFNKSVVRPFANYNTKRPTEKLHVHTDKDLYLDEEIIWFKAYASINNQPSNLSNKLYVQLLNNDSSYTKVIVPVKNGLAIGSLPLPKKMATGDYMLRAYTNWTDSLGQHYHFNKSLKIGLEEETLEDPVSTETPLLTVRAFPEGGHLVSGIENNVAFEIKNQWNQLVNADLTLYDDQGKLLQTIRPDWQGKGTFLFKPKKGKSYVLKSSVDPSLRVPLKVSEGMDLALLVKEEGKSLKVDIRSNSKEEKPVYMLVTANERVLDYQSLAMEESKTLDIDLAKLQDGINQITLFNYQFEPLAERLYFKTPENRSNIKLDLSNVTVSKREQSIITISGDDNIRSASLSAINSGFTYASESDNIFVSTYLRPHILGNVVGLDTEFTDSELAKNQLDLLMMVNGWRKYQWEEIKKMQQIASDTLDLLDGFQIKGRLTNGRKKIPAPNQMVYLVANDSSSSLFDTVTDAEGYFTFENVMFNDSTDLIFKVLENQKGKAAYNFEIEEMDWRPVSTNAPTLAAEGTVKAPFEATVDRQSLATISKFDGRTYYLNDAVIKGQVIKEEPAIPRLYSSANTKVLRMDDVEAAQKTNVFSVINMNFPRLRAIVAENTGSGGGDGFGSEVSAGRRYGISLGRNLHQKAGDEMLVFIDNVPVSAETLYFYNPLEIETIEVELSAAGPNSGNGMILIYTRRGQPFINGKDPNYALKRMKGYQQYIEFYAPDHTVLLDKSLDYRTTVYWNPSISNEERVVKFSNSDLEGKIQVILEGYTNDGIPFRSTNFYEVSGGE